MRRAFEWMGRAVRTTLLDQFRLGATPEAISAAVTVSFAIAIIPVIGVTTLLCILMGRLFRLNHIVMQVVNHSSYPLQLILLLPFIRLGEYVLGAEPIVLSSSMLIEEFNKSLVGFIAKFTWAYIHGLIGWVLIVPFACWILHLILRYLFRQFATKMASRSLKNEVTIV